MKNTKMNLGPVALSCLAHNGKLADGGPCRLPPIPPREDPNIDEHRADLWINSLYSGGPGGDTRNKLRRGYDQGYQDAVNHLMPWMPDDAPFKYSPVGYESALFRRAQIGDVIVPKNPWHAEHGHMRYAHAGGIMEFERVRVHGKVGWLRRS